jgi:hypothetical protein
MPQMTQFKLATSVKRILLLALSVGLAFLGAAAIHSGPNRALIACDFAEVYYSTRSALQHVDPYDPKAVLHEFKQDKGRIGAPDPKQEAIFRTLVTVLDYPPPTLLVVAPIALLPWHITLRFWVVLVASSMLVAALLIWEASGGASMLAGCMTCYMLFSCLIFLVFGNPAGLAVPFAVIAAWCFLEERYVPAGVVLFALSLAIKPQIGAFVWLYFLLAGERRRKWAMQTLAVAAVLSICAVVWITSLSPYWMHEFWRNFGTFSTVGGGADPGPSGNTFSSFDQIISLQSAVSVFRNNPHFYNPVTYLIAGGLILAWMLAVLRKRSTREGALLALAAISILTLLPIYHRNHDAKLLLLTIPACGVLWAGSGAKRWFALGLTAAAIIVTSDVPMLFWPTLVGKLSLSGKLALFAVHPAPLVLLAAGSFYLWVFIRYEPAALAGGYEFRGSAKNPTAEAAE